MVGCMRDQLCSDICKRENKKVSISMGNTREVLRILIDMQVDFTMSNDMCVNDSPIFILMDEVAKKVKAKEKRRKKA